LRTTQPKPFNITFIALIEFDWHCPQCKAPNHSRRPSNTEYLSAKCGKCHFWTLLDYHRYTDAPPAARALDGIHLGSTRGTPGIPAKFAQKPRRQHASGTQK